MTDDEAKERAEDARVIAEATPPEGWPGARDFHNGLATDTWADAELCARARERWPQAIADRDAAEAALAETSRAWVQVKEVARLDDQYSLEKERKATARADAVEARLAEAVALLRRWAREFRLQVGQPGLDDDERLTAEFLARIDGKEG